MFIMWFQAMMLCDFKQCFLTGFPLSYFSVICNILSHNIPGHGWHIKTYTHVPLVLIVSSQSEQKRLSYVYPCH